MKNEELSMMIPKEKIAKRVKELGQEITKDYAGKSIVVIGVLKGSFVFLADLIREIDLPTNIEFLGASSYGDGQTSSGVVKITMDLAFPVEGRDVLLVEDIVDTGLTLDFLLEHIRLQNPSSLKLCSLLQKPDRMKKEVPIDYLGFTIEDKFVVGYGLDAAGRYRNVPDVAVLEGSKE